MKGYRLLLLAGLAHTALAVDIEWTNENGGSFQDPSNWSSGSMPGPYDKAIFNLPNAYEITFSGDITNQWWAINAGEISLKLGEAQLNITGSLSIETGSLSLKEGTATIVGASIASQAGSPGSLLVTGEDSYLIATNGFQVGVGGEGEFRITDGGRVSSGQTYIGFQAGSQGLAIVSGTGSQWTLWNNHYVYLGRNGGQGTLRVEDGGYVYAPEAVIVGYSSSSQGSVTVTGKDSQIDTRNLYVGHDGEGELRIENGGRVTILPPRFPLPL